MGEISSLDDKLVEAIKLQQSGDRVAAKELYLDVLSEDVEHGEAHFRLSVLYLREGQIKLSVMHSKLALATNPDSAEIHTNLGGALKKMGKKGKALQHYVQAVELKPDFANAHNNRGALLLEMAVPVLAVDSFQRAIAANPANSDAHSNLGVAYRALNRHEEAVESFQNALQANPKMAEAYNNLATAQRDLGRIEEAKTNFLKAMELSPGMGMVHYNLSTLTVDPDETRAQIERMKSLYAESAEKVHLAFGLGSAYDKIDQYDDAFAYFSEGYKIKSATEAYDVNGTECYFRDIKGVFDHQYFESRIQLGLADPTPIFIVGMPRSGTSLVEQILASHPMVFGAGELNYFKNLCSPRPARPAGHPTLPAFRAWIEGEYFKIGEAYLDGLRAFSTEARYISDKMLANFQYIGMIKTVFPNVKIIHCERNSIDTCLSIYKKHFVGSHSYSHALESLGHYYGLYRALMKHWEKVLGGSFHSAPYEPMVADTESETRKLLDYFDLSFHEDCLQFYRSERAVQTTASEAQVRQPIYATSVGG